MSFTISDRDLDFNKWKVADLRKELKTRGLNVDGKKSELVERLQQAIGESSLLDENVNDQDEILDEDVVLTDDEAFEEEAELSKLDSPDKNSDSEKLKRLERRAAKFGVAMSNEAKKEARAARFGLPTAASKIGGLVNTNIDVLKKRAERFGTTLPGSILESAEIEGKRKKREERFGKVEKISPVTSLKGKYNFYSSTLEEKKRLRAERFKIK
ncbi:Nuclear protein Hcc-1, putative [Pediculus humanus corporis]|uniref:Nuclear protein Hcc-1, putative n=1 Tax=Pediculus humanus subsp. corporis TaxID=121224 RepID=E0W0B1_PEDHC|nr:Nuclear protein Hcc-1, putative [Pediculus humanus corporis]EEB19067.1 Nuclear protein Hcc-1, putative [Pediculus humanus corporis]